MARPRGKKRTAAQAAATDSSKPKADAGDSTKPEAAAAKDPAVRGRGNRAKAAPKPKAETEYFPEKRNMEDLGYPPFLSGLSGKTSIR